MTATVTDSKILKGASCPLRFHNYSSIVGN
jgi:hypothetical protein